MDAIVESVFYALYKEEMMFLNISVSILLQFRFVCVKLSYTLVRVSYGHLNSRCLLQPEHNLI
jgi:hypothetical protein